MRSFRLLVLLALLLAPGCAPARRAAAPVRALVVTGGHDYETSFYTLFEGDPALRWDHAVSSGDAFRADLRDRYDVVVLYDLSVDLDSTGRRHLRSFVESGRGLVVLHHALADYPGWSWWSEEVVGGRYLLGPDGDRPGSTYQHDVDLTARPIGAHPVTRGVGTLRLFDETYRGQWISPRVQVLLETDHPTSDRALAWVSPYERARVVVVQPGHGSPTHRHPGYRRLVRNAVFWTAGR